MMITATESTIRRVLLQVAGEQHMNLSVPEVTLLASCAARAVDARKKPRSPESGPGCPPDGLTAPRTADAAPLLSIASAKALQRLRLDPVAIAVVRLVSEHMSNREIAEHLGVTLDQVRYRMREWYTATGRNSRTGLASWARHAGLLGVTAAPGGPTAALNPAVGSTETPSAQSGPQAATQRGSR
jgi:DNA-binding CsgD family transcriptional regulator